MREINLADNVWKLGNIDCFTFTRDPNKLRAAAATLETAAKELRRQRTLLRAARACFQKAMSCYEQSW